MRVIRFIKAPVKIFFETQRYARVPAKGIDVNVEALDAQYLIEDLAELHNAAQQLLSSWLISRDYLELFSGLEESDIQMQVRRLEDVIKSTRRHSALIASDRFKDWPDSPFGTIDQLPVPPSFASGVVLEISLKTNWATGGYQESDGSLIEGFDLRGFSISDDALPEGTTIEYGAHLGTGVPGDHGWWPAPTMLTPEARVEGISVRIAGRDKDRFTIRYWFHRASSDHIYFGENGSFAGTRGDSMKCDGLRVQLVTN